MINIKLVKSLTPTNYIIDVNQNSIHLLNIQLGYAELKEFIMKIEKVFTERNINSFYLVFNNYGIKSFKNVEELFILGFPNQFQDFLLYIGQQYLEQGTYFSVTKILKNLNPKGSGMQKSEDLKNFIVMVEKKFLIQITLPQLRSAFKGGERSKVALFYKCLTYSKFMNLSLKELKQEFVSYLYSCTDALFKKNKVVSYSNLYSFAFGVQYLQYSYLSEPLKSLFTNLLNNKKYSLEKSIVGVGLDKWFLLIKNIQQVNVQVLKFECLPNNLKSEIQQYLFNWWQKGENEKAIARRYSNVMRIGNALVSTGISFQSLLDLTYVDVLNINDVLHQLKLKGKNKYSPKTIQGSFSEARMFFDWLNKKRNPNNSLNNPFRRFKYYNINSFVKNAKYIPEEIIEQLTNVIHECSRSIQLIWLIMMNTGMRVSEVLNLTTDCLVYDQKEKTFFLEFLASKNLKERRKKGLDDFHTIPLTNEELITKIREQIDNTSDLRALGNTNFIFILIDDIHRSSIKRYTGNMVSNEINKCIKKHQIKDHTGNLFHYANHQCRKTLAVSLLSEGSSITDVSQILGHLVEKTTQQYYQDVDSLKIAKLDQKLFEELFHTLDKKTVESYNPHDFEQLKQEIMLGARETPEGHGSCVKHVSFGPCKKRSCVGCSFLLTGPQKLPMWRKLYREQQKYVYDLRSLMIRQGIENYKDYRDFQHENHLLNLYKNTIEQLEKFMKERDLNF
ncbi:MULTISPECIES: tyrosine-type recombinase/integrase [Bacillus]|uniref:tyrosine-type recombinase/integrase n=1 Tax=Bacillus TaxID=1386 RepID=UPI0005303521|nr:MULTISPECIES: site-specific integrase [Bacillus subtilis group]AIX08024.1 Tyrosine recombinase XerC [Bacillus subtilis]QIW85319.1 site-specific integrase [Bacillus velezensis]